MVVVAVAGLYSGNVTVKDEAYMSINLRLSFNFRDIVAFPASSAAFFYLGVRMNSGSIVQNLSIIMISHFAVFETKVMPVAMEDERYSLYGLGCIPVCRT